MGPNLFLSSLSSKKKGKRTSGVLWKEYSFLLKERMCCFNSSKKRSRSNIYFGGGSCSERDNEGVLSQKAFFAHCFCLCGRLNVEVSSHIPQISVQRTLLY